MIIPALKVGDLTNPYLTKYTTHEIGFETTLETATATINLSNSLLIAPVINITPEDTWAERLAKQLDIEARFPYVNLSLYVDTGDGLGWVRRATLALHNLGGEYYQPLLTPFLTYNKVRLLGIQDMIGVSVSQKPAEGDFILIDGSWAMNISLLRL